MTNRPQVPEPAEQIASEVLASVKYRNLCPDTVRRVAAEEWDKRVTLHLSLRQALKQASKATRSRLHEIYGAYESRVDYRRAYQTLEAAYAEGTPEAIWPACRQVLSMHVSTRERLPILDGFYKEVFALTGVPRVLLDLASGLNPLCLPWMGLEEGAVYYAYDIDAGRVAFLNRYFSLAGVRGGAFLTDLVTTVPGEEGDVALLMKSSNCLERQREGRTLELLDALRVKCIVVTFPPRSLGGREKGMRKHYSEAFAEMLATRPWPVLRLDFRAEMAFVVTKTVGPEGHW